MRCYCVQCSKQREPPLGQPERTRPIAMFGIVGGTRARKAGNIHEGIGVSDSTLRAVQDHSPEGRYSRDLHEPKAQAAPRLALDAAQARKE